MGLFEILAGIAVFAIAIYREIKKGREEERRSEERRDERKQRNKETSERIAIEKKLMQTVRLALLNSVRRKKKPKEDKKP